MLRRAPLSRCLLSINGEQAKRAEPKIVDLSGLAPSFDGAPRLHGGANQIVVPKFGDDRARTGGLLLAKQTLYQLSYVPGSLLRAHGRTRAI